MAFMEPHTNLPFNSSGYMFVFVFCYSCFFFMHRLLDECWALTLKIISYFQKDIFKFCFGFQVAVQIMCVVPKRANDMMAISRLQGFDVSSTFIKYCLKKHSLSLVLPELVFTPTCCRSHKHNHVYWWSISSSEMPQPPLDAFPFGKHGAFLKEMFNIPGGGLQLGKVWCWFQAVVECSK